MIITTQLFKHIILKFREILIKPFVHIAPSDFSSGWTNKPQ